MRLAGETAFITVASNGMGRAAALAFASEGARAIATDVDAAALASLAPPAIRTHVLDVCERWPARCARAVARRRWRDADRLGSRARML